MTSAPPALGPFRPPSTLEPEFQLPAPRPVPDELREGRHAKSQATGVYFGAFFAVACLALWWLGRATNLQYYFLALPYLPWIAGGVAALAALAVVVGRALPGKYVYVRDGLPMPCRVLDIHLVVARLHNGVPNAYRYDCVVEYSPPGSSEPRQRVVSSPEFAAMFKDSTFTPLRVGDYVTAVALPRELEKTFTLYGFLQLSPKVDFVQRRGQDVAGISPPFEALKALALVSGGLALLLGVTCVPSMLPLSLPEKVDPARVGAAAAAVFAGGLIWTLRWMRRSEAKRRADLEQKNQEARREGRPVEQFAPAAAGWHRALLPVAGGFFPVFVLTLLVAAANAGFDRSGPTYQVVKLKDYRQETWLFMFRSYEVRYLGDDSKAASVKVPVTQLAWFQRLSPELGALEWRQGRWGMPWIRTIHPVVSSDDGSRMHVAFPDGSLVPVAARED